MKKLIFATLFSTMILLSFAYKIEGIVSNKNTSAPLSNAVIILMEDNAVVESVTSNFSGRFTLSLKKDRTYKLEIIKDGYKTETTVLDVNQAFVEAAPTLTVHLLPLDFVPVLGDMKLGMKDNLNQDIMEDIGNIDDLPEGYKIIEAVPLKSQNEEKSRFNVGTGQNNYEYTNVNVEVLKDDFNKESVEESMYKAEGLLPSSYYVEGEIMYGEGKALLTEEIEEMLVSVAEKLKAEPNTKLRLSAYADGGRESKIGDFIAKMRAEEITKFLMKQDVPFEQLEVTITGNKFLENGCYTDVRCDEYQHQENRRVVLELVK